MQARNRGAAVLLVCEDLDEILELADRILVISEGKIVHETPSRTPTAVIGQHMAGHYGRPARVSAGADARFNSGKRRRRRFCTPTRGPMPTIAAQPYDYTSTAIGCARDHRHAARLHRAGRLRRGAGQRRLAAAARHRPAVARLLDAFRQPRPAGRAHQGVPPSRPVRLSAGQAPPRQAGMRIGDAGPDGPHPDRRRTGQRLRGRIAPRPARS